MNETLSLEEIVAMQQILVILRDLPKDQAQRIFNVIQNSLKEEAK